MSTIEIEIPRTLQTLYLNVAFGGKDLAMSWCKQLKSETCFLKKVCFK